MQKLSKKNFYLTKFELFSVSLHRWRPSRFFKHDTKRERKITQWKIFWIELTLICGTSSLGPGLASFSLFLSSSKTAAANTLSTCENVKSTPTCIICENTCQQTTEPLIYTDRSVSPFLSSAKIAVTQNSCKNIKKKS